MAPKKPVPGIFTIESIPQTAMSYGDMRWNKTGSWRYVRPVYYDKEAPCNFNCPAGNDVRGFLKLVQDGKYIEAWLLFKETSPFPATCGRVCYHPCETFCNRKDFDTPVAIHTIERFVADYAFQAGAVKTELPARNEFRVAIVGSGPAGLSCAYQLALRGYNVTVFESQEKPGGMLKVGIPDYRLPSDILEREINAILDLGVELKLNTAIGKDIPFEALDEYDAVYVAAGSHTGKALRIDGEDLPGVVSGLSILYDVNLGRKPELGKRVSIIGGGNTAIDTARSVLRMGSEPTVVYRRSRKEMPAWDEEVKEAEKEGIKFIFLTAPVLVHSSGGKVSGLECQQMKLGEKDSSGRRRPEPVKGSNYIIETDMVVRAIGEDPDINFIPAAADMKWGRLVVDGSSMVKSHGFFAGGDAVVDSPGTVSAAIGSGRKGAEAINSILTREEPEKIEKPEVVKYSDLNTYYFKKEDRAEPVHLETKKALEGFREIVGGISLEDAVCEAERCFTCGICTMCDNCMIFCPDASISVNENNSGYTINYDFCKGCGVCSIECPRNAIKLEREEKWRK